METANIFKKNIEALFRKPSPCLEVLSQEKKKEDIEFEKFRTISGHKTIRIKHNNRELLLHSLYNPIHEAVRYCDNLNFNKDTLIIVFGLGMGHHVLELYKRMTENSRIIVVEHRINLLKDVMQEVDFSEMIDAGKIAFAAGSIEDIKKQILFCLCHNMHYLSSNIQIYYLPNLEKIDYEKNLEIMKYIRSTVRNNIFSFGNLIEDTVLGMNNVLDNIDTVIESPAVEEAMEHYKGKPAVIVSAGPSLSKNMHLLKEIQGKALILACDASLQALLDIGVKPDAVLSLERGEPTYNYFYKDKVYPEDIVLIGSVVLWKDIFSEYKGKKIVIQKPDAIGNWINTYAHNSNFDIGMSVSTLAFAVAEAMGCGTIILIGQDLAYTGGKRHSDETEYQKDDTSIDAQIMIEGVNGEMLPSIEVFRMFRDWFENRVLLRNDINMINATEGGALIKGYKHMTFREAIDTYCTKDIGYRLNDVIRQKDISREGKGEIISKVIDDLHERIGFFESIGKMSDKHMTTLKDIVSQYDVQKCSEKKLETILKKLNYGNTIIKKIKDSDTEAKTYFGQLIAQAVINVKKMDAVLSGENVQRNIEIQYALMKYLNEVSDYLIKEYEGFIEKMQKKLEAYS